MWKMEVKWVQLHQQERGSMSQTYLHLDEGLELHGAKVDVCQWWQVTFSENSFNWDVEYEGEETLHYCQYLRLSVAATAQSSHAESQTLLSKSHRHLQDSDTQNTRYWAQYDNAMLVKISPLNFSSGQILCMLIHPQGHCVCSSCENLWSWSFSSARKHLEPRTTLLPPAESHVLTLFSSQTTSLSGHTSFLIRA